LRHAIARLQASILETRRLSELDQTIAGKTLLDLARIAKR
jgi:DNA polymerase-3 subunit delta